MKQQQRQYGTVMKQLLVQKVLQRFWPNDVPKETMKSMVEVDETTSSLLNPISKKTVEGHEGTVYRVSDSVWMDGEA